MLLSLEVAKREVGSGERLVEPGRRERAGGVGLWGRGAMAVGRGCRGAGVRNGSVRTLSLPSSIQARWPSGRSDRVCTRPLGHAIVTFTMRWLLPRPKSSSLECWEMNPEPAFTIRVARPWSVSTVTRAPTASRLLLVPVSRSASCGVAGGEVVAEEAKLRRRARRHQDQVRVAVAVVVEQREGAAVLVEVEPHRAGDLVEAAAAVVAQKHVPLVAVPATRASRAAGWSRASASSYGVPVWRTSGERAVTCRQKKLSTSTSCSSPSRVNMPLTT